MFLFNVTNGMFYINLCPYGLTFVIVLYTEEAYICRRETVEFLLSVLYFKYHTGLLLILNSSSSILFRQTTIGQIAGFIKFMSTTFSYL